MWHQSQHDTLLLEWVWTVTGSRRYDNPKKSCTVCTYVVNRCDAFLLPAGRFFLLQRFLAGSTPVSLFFFNTSIFCLFSVFVSRTESSKQVLTTRPHNFVWSLSVSPRFQLTPPVFLPQILGRQRVSTAVDPVTFLPHGGRSGKNNQQ